MQWQWIGLGFVLVSMLVIGAWRWMQMVQQRAIDLAEETTAQERIRFLQRLDHELKNPLTAMQIALANLDAIEDTAKKSEIRHGMRGQIERMSRLIGDLRKLALLDRTLIEQVSFGAGDLLQDVAQIVQEHPILPDRHFIQDYDANSLPSITGDRDLLQMALYNLLDNALKFTQSGNTITLRAYTENHTLIIEVEDDGSGIEPEELPHIWEDLYRSKAVQGIPGSGIGLALVKGIIERHNGTVDVISAPNSSTRFIVILSFTSSDRG